MISVKSDWELFTKVERGCVGFISNFNTHEFPRLMTIHRLTTQHVKKLQKIDRKGNSLCAEEQCSSVGKY